ncbi:MAG: hypothetical protein JW704_00445 [Anaerolineaceae bacterium]|nr:hypothetical protein [Anaerolineaceae bacterium]MBN2678380.1 hypothetical protein [Anaerolineaceae bacterium]
MSEDMQKQIIKSGGGGFFQDISTRIKLIIRLMRDKRVSFLLKILPLSTLVYLVIPEFMPVIDDALIMWLGTYLFVELCPDEIVEEHLRVLQKKLASGSNQPAPEEPTVVDAEYREVDETKP